jgi:YYY domain-containing protein
LSWFSDALRWYGVLLVISQSVAPWAFLLFRRLPDRGVTFARPLGLLAVIYPSWLLSSLNLTSYSTAGLWITAVSILIAGWAYLIFRGELDRSWLTKLVITEALGVAAFVGYLWLHGYTPEIMVTEKPMDEALLSASSIASQMPPLDPWLSGHTINYYYLGYVIHGAVTRMSHLSSSIGFSFALATTVSMTIVATAGVAFNIVRNWFGRNSALAASGLSVFFLAIGGNLYAATKFLQSPRQTIDAAWWPYGGPYSVGWSSSRVVVDSNFPGNVKETINEFPSFSFILADLHPHVMALPFTIASLSLALNLLRYRSDEDAPSIRSVHLWVTLIVTGAFIGSLYALNSWDLPTYLFIALVGLFVGLNNWRIKHRLVAAGGLVLAALLAWLPFTATFVPFFDRSSVAIRPGLKDIPVLSWILTTIGKVTWDRTSVSEFLTIFGIPYVACLILLGFAISDPEKKVNLRYPRLAFAVLFGVTLVALLIPMPLLVLCGVPLGVCALILTSREPSSPLWVATAFFGLGFLIILTTEFFYIQDVFHNRMNTLFKAYYQVWTLFGIAASIAVVAVWRDQRRSQFVRPALTVLTAAAIALAGIYPILSAKAWTNNFADWKGLDGAAFVSDWSPGELAAIEWLRENASDDDVVLEQLGCSYSPNAGVPRLSRVSTFTGIPTIIGWAGHEGQWRAGQQDLLNILPQREKDVQSMYSDPESDLLNQYGVNYIYVGKYELEGADSQGCAKAIPYPNAADPSFPGAGWDEVFNEDGVRIYHRAAAN